MPAIDHRIIEIAGEGCGLRVDLERLVIRRNAGTTTVPLDEIACLVIAHPQCHLTHAVLAGIARAGGIVVVCDRTFQPAGMLLPLDTHFVQGERFRRQAAASLPTTNRIWQTIIKAKIRMQATALTALVGVDSGLAALAKQVKPGDSANLEAQAAQRYWTALFGSANFRRDREAPDQNRLLNYGYTVLRAVVARAICGAGLHPALGVHHHNRYDSFALASDLMEPFRPLVDVVVAHLVRQHGEMVELTQDIRRKLIESCTGTCRWDGENRLIFSAVALLASSVAAVFEGRRRDIVVPLEL